MVTSACVISRPDGEVTWNLHLREPWYVEPFETTLPRSFSYKSAVSRMPIVCTCHCSDIPRKLPREGRNFNCQRRLNCCSASSAWAKNFLGSLTWLTLTVPMRQQMHVQIGLHYSTSCAPTNYSNLFSKEAGDVLAQAKSSKVQDSLPWTQHQPFGTVHLPLKSPFTKTSQNWCC